MENKKSVSAILKKIYRVFVSTLAIILVVSVVVLFLLFTVAKKDGETPFVFGKSFIWIVTDSMSDTIPQNTCILIDKYDGEDISADCIITFRSEDQEIYGMLNTHRVVGVNDKGEYITKGDKSGHDDELPVRKDQIVGVYEKQLPAITAFGRIIKTPMGTVGLLALVLIAVGSICVSALSSIVKNREKEMDIDREQMINDAIQAEVERLKREGLDKKEAEK